MNSRICNQCDCVAGCSKNPEPCPNLSPRHIFTNGQQVCANDTQSCPSYTVKYQKPGCDYCERGIIDKQPHRLCPVLHESAK